MPDRRREAQNGAVKDRGRFAPPTLHDFDGRLKIDMTFPGDRGWEQEVPMPDATAEDVSTLDWGALPPSGNALTASEALVIAQYMASQLKAKGLRTRATPADIAQATVAKLNRQPGIHEINQPLILRAIGREAVNIRNAELGLRHEDVKALGILWANRNRAVSDIGRPLTRPEYDRMAESVRDQWPNARHRPRARFHALTAPPHLT